LASNRSIVNVAFPWITLLIGFWSIFDTSSFNFVKFISIFSSNFGLNKTAIFTFFYINISHILPIPTRIALYRSLACIAFVDLGGGSWRILGEYHQKEQLKKFLNYFFLEFLPNYFYHFWLFPIRRDPKKSLFPIKRNPKSSLFSIRRKLVKKWKKTKAFLLLLQHESCLF